MSKTSARVLVVVPTYNERGNLPEVYQRVFKAVPRANLLIVDDNSPDGTGDLAESMAKRDKRVKVMHRGAKSGLGSAYVAGFQWALDHGYASVVAMDADLSHDPSMIPKKIQLSKESDLVIGSRYVPGGGMVRWGLERFAISRSANWFLKILLGLREADCTGGFKCYSASLLRKIGMGNIFSPGYSFQVEILFRAHRVGARVREFPIVFVNRHEGESKLNLKEVTGFFKTVLWLRALAWAGKV